ncbi:MAG: FtsX-like permease family protein [Planctomycetes bacterium]|nr:FtsX-like permease family protein [Planctomycetota bacterium]
MKRSFVRVLPALILLGEAGAMARCAAEDGPQITPEEAKLDAIPLDKVKEHVAKLAAMNSRLPGMPGNKAARDYIVQKLTAMGYRDATDTVSQSNDALDKAELSADAATEAGQTFGTIAAPGTAQAPFNIRITIADEDNSITEGVVEVKGTGLDGQAQSEELKLKASVNRKNTAAGDKPFINVRALVLKKCTGATPKTDNLSAGYDTRFHIGAQQFWGVAPFDGGDGKLQVTGADGSLGTFPIYAVWPNGAALAATGRSGLSGPVIYAGRGQATDFDDLPVDGALVVLDFPEGRRDSGEARWTQAAGFGAKAVLYIEPETALRPNLERLFCNTPVEFPRFWMPRKDGLALKAFLEQERTKKAVAKGTAKLTTAWKREIWENLYLLVPGSGAVMGQVKEADKLKAKVQALTPNADAAKAARDKAAELLGQDKVSLRELQTALAELDAGLKAEQADAGALKAPLDELRGELASTVVLAAYYDSNSAVPAIAPGAEQALSCAALLELARRYREAPPPRDTLLLFCNGHFQGLKGEREFFSAIEKLPESSSEGELAKTLGKVSIYAGKDRANTVTGSTYDGILTQAAQGGPETVLQRLERGKLLEFADKAAKAYEADTDSRDLEAMKAEEIAKKGGVSVNSLIAVIALLLMGIGQVRKKLSSPLLALGLLVFGGIVGKEYLVAAALSLSAVLTAFFWFALIVAAGAAIMGLRERYTARLLLGLVQFFVAVVLAVFYCLLPFLSSLAGTDRIGDRGARLDEALNMMKEDAATQETELERQLRVMRAETDIVPVYELAGKKREAATVQAVLAKDPRAKADLDEFDRIEKERLEYEDAGRFLYTLTTQGLSLHPPENLDRLKDKLDRVARLTLARAAEQRAWAWLEYDRRKSNRCFNELAADRLSRACENETGRKTLFLSLDLSAGHEGVGLFYKGAFYNQPGDIESKYKGYWGRMVMPIARAVEKSQGGNDAGSLMPDTLLENKGRRWDTFLGTPLALATEIAVQAQVRGLTLATPYDRRLGWDNPQDTLERLNLQPAENQKSPWSNVDSQLRLAGPFLRRFMAEGSVTQESRFNEKLRFTGFAQVIFKTVRRGGSRSIFPDIPVPDALVFTCMEPLSAAGVRLGPYECTNPLGQARMPGLRTGARWNFELQACDPESGEITFVTNKPKHGLDENRSFASFIGAKTRTEQVELFAAQGVAALDLIDPRYFVPLRNCKLLAGQTESQPQAFGSTNSYLQEAHRVLYAEPGTRIKCLFREGQFGVRLTLLDVQEPVVERLLNKEESAKVTAAEARGPGFQLGTKKVLPWLPKRTGIDLWCLGEQRLGELRAHSIGNPKLDNPDYPGADSAGTVKVTEGSDEVERDGGPADAKPWGDHCLRMRFRVLATGQSYGVKAVKGPNALVLDQPYAGTTSAKEPFVLTNQDPGLHNLAKLRLGEAAVAEKAGKYGTAWQRYTEAWGLESRAYPEVLGTAHDSVMGVVFYLFLLLPFCFFMERLLIASPTIERQIGAFFGAFVLMFGLLWWVHPAFSLVAAPPIILLAFVIMSLASIVIAIVYGKFNAEMRMMQQGMQGVQSADVNRASAGLVAVTLGISQMRRRKLRTFLTCLTVVLLTFTALSFTSMVPSISQAHIDLSPGVEKDAPYQGIMMRQLNWDNLRVEAYDEFVSELEPEHLRVVPRFWRVAKADQKIFVDLINGEGKIASPSSMMGLSPHEAELFPDKIKESLAAGRWLKEGDRSVILIPTSLSTILRPVGVKEEDWTPEKALGQKLKLGSYEVEVIGVYKPDVFGNDIRDLDGEPMTPVDFSASQASRGAEAKSDQTADVESIQGVSSNKYQHVSAGESVIVPWSLAVLLGADLRSVAVKIDDPKKLDYVKDRLLKRVQKNLFVGIEGRRRLYASTPSTSLSGAGNLVVPMAISILILLNVMIGAVYERNREIKIFSALGLAPSHISALFLAEAIVYATLGAILGYLLGQGTAKFIQVFGEQLGIGGLYLNYSSSSAVFVTGLVMLAVVVSTIYPMWEASRAASPSEERSWGVPDPVGDEISLELPFSFQRDLVPGAALFLHEYFDSHAESSLGKFTAKEVTLEAFHTDHGQGMCLFFIAWLSPYDLGVSQEVQIYVVPTTEGLYVTEASFFRISGYVTSWQRVNLPFLNALRKHLLIWRTFSPPQRLDYAIRGYYQFQEAFEAVGWPPPEGMELPQREELDNRGDEDEEEPAAQPLEPKPASDAGA